MNSKQPVPITPANACGEIGRRIVGKVVAEVSTNGEVLRITSNDGSEIGIVWVDDNGNVLKGKPLIVKHGIRLRAEGMRDIITAHAAGLPELARKK